MVDESRDSTAGSSQQKLSDEVFKSMEQRGAYKDNRREARRLCGGNGGLFSRQAVGCDVARSSAHTQ